MQGTARVPPHVTARVIAHCGVAHPFADLLAGETLVVIDPQIEFTDDAIGNAVCPGGHNIVPRLNMLAGALCGAGSGVFWVMDTFGLCAVEEWGSLLAKLTPQARARREATMTEGSVGQQRRPLFDGWAADSIVRKQRISSSLPCESDLEDLPRTRGFDAAPIAGPVTYARYKSTARDATVLNFCTVMVSDANAAMTPEEHRARCSDSTRCSAT